MERVVARSAPAHRFVLVVGSLGFVAVGVFILHENPIVGWITIVFFGACALMGVRQLFDSRLRLVIDDSGVWDRMLAVGVIEWPDIRSAFIKTTSGHAFVCLELRDPVKYTTRLSPIVRRTVTLNRSLGFDDISLNLVGTGRDLERVLERILEELARRRSADDQP